MSPPVLPPFVPGNAGFSAKLGLLEKSVSEAVVPGAVAGPNSPTVGPEGVGVGARAFAPLIP